MLVKAMVKTKECPDPNSQGAQRGDICYLWPLNKDHGSKVLGTFMAVVMDLNIPCGKDFDNQPPKCGGCKFDYPDTCDNRRIESAVRSSGDLFNPPKLLKKFQFKIDIESLVSADSLPILYKTDRTQKEKEKILSDALKNPVNKTIIINKVVK